MMPLENILVIKGGTYLDIKRALRLWIKCYLDELPADLSFQLFMQENGSLYIQADTRISNEQFFFLVNYLKYPEKIKYDISVEGFVINHTLGVRGRELLVYFPVLNQTKDCVYLVNSGNEHYKVDFAGSVSEIIDAKKYSTPEVPNLEIAETIDITRAKKGKENQKKSIEKLQKRFNILHALFFLSIVFLSFIHNPGVEFNKYYFGISFVYYFWLFWDYKLLQRWKLYLISLGFSLLIFLFGWYNDSALSNQLVGGVVPSSGNLPFLFLLMQWPVRHLFIILFRREPLVEKPSPSLPDFIYTILLLLVPLFLSYYLIALNLV